MDTIDTICGPFTRERTEDLRQALDAAEKNGTSREETIKFEDNDLLVSFGTYLLEFLDNSWEGRK